MRDSMVEDEEACKLVADDGGVLGALVFAYCRYVTLFAAAFPLTAALALLNNMIEIRTDAYKLLQVLLCYMLLLHTLPAPSPRPPVFLPARPSHACTRARKHTHTHTHTHTHQATQRPSPKRAADIGTWMVILDIIATCSILTNCALVGFTSHGLFFYFPNMTSVERVWITLICEHLLLLFKAVLDALLNSPPKEVPAPLHTFLWRALPVRRRLCGYVLAAILCLCPCVCVLLRLCPHHKHMSSLQTRTHHSLQTHTHTTHVAGAVGVRAEVLFERPDPGRVPVLDPRG